LAEDRIEAKSMVHFIGEFFGIGLREGVFAQRLLMSIMADSIRDKLKSGSLNRDGDDLFFNERHKSDKRKLSVSIVTSSPVSQLLHVGINIDPAGAPVPAVGLAELGIDSISFAQEVLQKFSAEWSDIHWACTKVRPVM
jgi:uncharacterized protein